MLKLSTNNYWSLCRLRPDGEYTSGSVAGKDQTQIDEFISSQLESAGSTHSAQDVQVCLLNLFNPEGTQPSSEAELYNSAWAGYCLRCWVSHDIVWACKRLVWSFRDVDLKDLLPCVLNDDGKKFIVLLSSSQLNRKGEPKKSQFHWTSGKEPKPEDYPLFGVELLQTFKPRFKSLRNWTFRLVKQNPDISEAIGRKGIKRYSDWYLLCQTKISDLENVFDEEERLIIQTFKDTYRSDRRNRGHHGVYQAPTTALLTTILGDLRKQGVVVGSTDELFNKLSSFARELRKYENWQHSFQPLDAGTGDDESQPRVSQLEDPKAITSPEEAEEAEQYNYLLQLLTAEKLAHFLDCAIATASSSKLAKLRGPRSRYKQYADRFLQGYRLYYEQAKSITEIGEELGIGNRNVTGRVLGVRKLLKRVRSQVAKELLRDLLERFSERLSVNSQNQVTNLIRFDGFLKLTEAVLDASVFKEAFAEINDSKNRSRESLYAQRLRAYLSTHS